MDNSDLPVLDSPDYMKAYDLVEAGAKAFLDVQEPGAVFTTADLAHALWDEEDKIPPRLWRGLSVRANFGLAPYVRKGPPVMKFGRLATPLIWRRPKGDLK